MAEPVCVECILVTVGKPTIIECELCKAHVCVLHIKAHHKKHTDELAIHRQALKQEASIGESHGKVSETNS
jgi:hypothetical protein